MVLGYFGWWRGGSLFAGYGRVRDVGRDGLPFARRPHSGWRACTMGFRQPSIPLPFIYRRTFLLRCPLPCWTLIDVRDSARRSFTYGLPTYTTAPAPPALPPSPALPLHPPTHAPPHYSTHYARRGTRCTLLHRWFVTYMPALLVACLTPATTPATICG